MSGKTETPAGRGRLLAWILVPALAAAFAAANAHLVYVAVNSQPECVPHSKRSNGDGRFSAAKPSC